MEGRGGLYLEDCGVAAVNDDEKATNGVRSFALDPEAATRLWSVSEKMVGEHLALRVLRFSDSVSRLQRLSYVASGGW